MTGTISALRAHDGDLPAAEVVDVAEQLGIDFAMAPFTLDELKLGIEVEREQERLATMVGGAPTGSDGDDLAAVSLIAAAHLREQPRFYTYLTTAHAPGDPPLPHLEHLDIGTD